MWLQTDKDSDYDLLLLHIWCKAILRDRWGDISTDDPMESCKDTVFFKTLELAYTEGRSSSALLARTTKVLLTISCFLSLCVRPELLNVSVLV